MLSRKDFSENIIEDIIEDAIEKITEDDNEVITIFIIEDII